MHDAPTCGSLFSGAGLLDAGLAMAGFEHAWVCESDEFRRGLLARRFPGAVVYDDIRTLRGQPAADAARDAEGGAGPAPGPIGERAWPRVDHAACVDLIAGGFPCKGASSAGKQNGFEHAETVLWHEMRRVVGEFQPRYVLIENVANILGMAAAPGLPAGSLWGTVLGDLAALGFDVVWDCVPAAAVGAPHLRDRVFAIACHPDGTRRPAGRESERAERGWPRHVADEGSAAPSADTDDAHGQGHGSAKRVRAQIAGTDSVHDQPAADAARDAEGGAGPAPGPIGERAWPRAGQATADAGSLGCEWWPDQQGEGRAPAQRRETRDNTRDRDSSSARGIAVEWGDYQPAITRWETIHGPAPESLVRRLDDGDAKLRRVRARVDRSRLSALGDGVHVYCGWLVGLAIREHMRTGRWGP